MRLTIACLFALFLSPLVADGQAKRPLAPHKARTAARRPSPARTVVQAEKAPPAIGPYSQAIVVGDLVYTSGQIALDPKTGEMAGGGTGEQAEQVLKNLAAVLEAAGSSLDRVVKTTVFLADMNDFAAMNEVYKRHFKTDPPARSTVGVARLPRDARIEIEAVAVRGK